MDKLYVKSVLEGLKSSSSLHVQECLLKIRNKIITNDNGNKLFTECDGLSYLIPHLRKPNERILGLVLSILGNCCLNNECRLEVEKLHVVPPLISVLKIVCRDSIVGRACRLVGNIAQNHSIAEDLHNHGAVPALVTLIESRDKDTSYPTLTMAVRAIRQLWTVTDKREEMLSVNSVRCIAILLTTECESAGILKSDNSQLNETSELRKSQEELISGILKCLGYFTTHATAQCAEQIQGDGRGFQSLVALTKYFESLALRCLMSLCFLSSCRPLLGTAGLVPSLVSILQKNSDVCCWPEGAARTLAQLSGESVNRARIRHAGGLPLLIAAAREHTFALRALLQYVFDDTSFQMLVNEGLIGLVVEELKKHVMTMDCEHDYKEPVKESNSKDIPKKSKEVKLVDCDDGKTGLFKRRKCSNDEDSLSVVIERDNMFVGFSETIDTDVSDSQNEDDSSQNRRKRLKRSRSRSPTSFIKRCRSWSADVYWEMKTDREGANAKSPMSPEAAPMSPRSDGGSGLSPEWRAGRRARRDWSPESGFCTGESSAAAASPYWAGYQWSPASSAGPTSPLSLNEDSTDSDLSGRYSPVCSEHEAEEAAGDEGAGELDAAQVALDELAVHDLDALDDEPARHTENESYLDMNSSRIACVLVLIYRVTNGSYDPCSALKEQSLPNHTLDQLTSKDCLNALLDYMERCRKPMGRVARILTLIFSNALCLTNILKHKIALRLHNMSLTTNHPVSKCQQCRLLKKLSVKLMTGLTSLAEASYGVGEISFQLLRGPDWMKETLSLTLPYIVKSKAILRKYYIDCNALLVLFAAVPATKEEFQCYITALGKLSTNVRIKDPKLLESRFLDHITLGYDPMLQGLSKDEIVTFELDDMSTVKANKTFLCQNSEVFCAMLTGCFKESIEEFVKIKNVSKQGLEYLLTLLHCGLNNSNCDVKVFPMADDLETNLEVLLLADRFLFEKLKVLLNSAILQFKMTPDTADKIYIWSLSQGMGFLCVESVAYLLTGKMCESKRSQAFRNILNLEYKEQWLDDVKAVIIRQLEDWS